MDANELDEWRYEASRPGPGVTGSSYLAAHLQKYRLMVREDVQPEPEVDPLLVEARELTIRWFGAPAKAEDLAYDALKRGIEIGRERAGAEEPATTANSPVVDQDTLDTLAIMNAWWGYYRKPTVRADFQRARQALIEIKQRERRYERDNPGRCINCGYGKDRLHPVKTVID